MITVPNFKILTSLPTTPNEGDYAVCEDTQKVYVFAHGEWEEFNGKGTLDLKLYDLNKTVMAQLPAHNFKQRLADTKLIKEFIENHDYKTQYYMLLGRDLNYYTVFSLQHFDYVGPSLSKELMACLDSIGEILDFNLTQNKDAIEIWVRNKQDKQAYCLMFFDYTNGVIEVSK